MKEKKQTEAFDKDYPLDHVPMNARVGLISLSAVLLGITFFGPTIVAGGQVAASFTLNKFITIMLIGNLILGLYVGVMAMIGTKTGLTSVILARYTLGTAGAKWADLLLGGTQLGWYAVSSAYIAQMFVKCFNMPDWYIFWVIFWSVIIGLTAIYGFKGMEIVSYIALPLIIILVLWAPILAIKEVGSWAAMAAIKPTGDPMSMTTAITIVVGTFASCGTQVSNWSRFAKNVKISFFAALIAFFLGNSIMIFAGGVSSIAFKQPDIVEVFFQMGIIFWAMLIITINIWTTNDAAAYNFGVAGAEFFNKKDKKPFIIWGVVIATILAVTGVWNLFIPFLVMLGVFIPPLGGVIIGDFIFTWKKEIPNLNDIEFKTVRIANIIAYLIGTLAAWLGQEFGFGIPPLQGIILAAIMVPVMNRIIKNDNHIIKNNQIDEAK